MATYTYDFATVENPVSNGGAFTAGPGDWRDSEVATTLFVRSTAINLFTGGMLDTTANGGLTIGADQYSQMTLKTWTGTSGREGGPTVRGASTTDGDCYMGDADGETGTLIVWKCTDSGTLSFTSLASKTQVAAVDDVFKLQVVGSDLTLYRNGGSELTPSDTSWASGQPGFWVHFYGSTTIDQNRWGSFEAGDVVAGGGGLVTRKPLTGVGL